VPICVLTDGREWSFHLPSGQGSYEDRRVYRLQLDDREPEECQRVLTRYLARDRVRDGSAFEDAQRDYRDAAGRREAATALPRAWHELLGEPEELLLDIVSDKAEALCGFKPGRADVLGFLSRLVPGESGTSTRGRKLRAPTGAPTAAASAVTEQSFHVPNQDQPTPAAPDRSVTFTIFGQQHTCLAASLALVEILRILAERDPAKVQELAHAIKGRSRSLIAHTVAEINPARPDLARAAEFAPGWLIGLNTSNREKMGIVRTAARVFGLRMPEELDLTLPNS
jgi:hypothetical protein